MARLTHAQRLAIARVDTSHRTSLEIPFCDYCGTLMPEYLRAAAEGQDLDGLCCSACQQGREARERRRTCSHELVVKWWQLSRSRFMFAECTTCGLLEPYRPGAGYMGTAVLPLSSSADM